jgi:hypothetical protein
MYAFVSYQTDDKVVAGKVKAVLEGLGIPAFLAHEDIGVSEEWRIKLLQELAKADLFVALLSKSYFQSIWCTQESGIAAFKKKMLIVPFSLDGTVPQGFMGHIQSTKIDPANPLPTDILPGIAKRNLAFVIDMLTTEISKSGSFRGAEWDFQQILPYLPKATNDQIVRLLTVSADNGQVCHAQLCASRYLPPLLASHGDLLDAATREKLTKCVEAYKS